MQRPSNRNRLSLRRAFTLVELLIVIIIIAVLAAIAIPKFANSSTRSKESALRSNLKVVRNAVENFRADTGMAPQTLVDLTKELGSAPTQGINSSGTVATLTGTYRGPYMQAVPSDSVSNAAIDYTTTGGTILIKPNAATLALTNDSSGTPFAQY